MQREIVFVFHHAAGVACEPVTFLRMAGSAQFETVDDVGHKFELGQEVAGTFLPITNFTKDIPDLETPRSRTDAYGYQQAIVHERQRHAPPVVETLGEFHDPLHEAWRKQVTGFDLIGGEDVEAIFKPGSSSRTRSPF